MGREVYYAVNDRTRLDGDKYTLWFACTTGINTWSNDEEERYQYLQSTEYTGAVKIRYGSLRKVETTICIFKSQLFLPDPDETLDRIVLRVVDNARYLPLAICDYVQPKALVDLFARTLWSEIETEQKRRDCHIPTVYLPVLSADLLRRCGFLAESDGQVSINLVEA